jgi:hypothetical protein
VTRKSIDDKYPIAYTIKKSLIREGPVKKTDEVRIQSKDKVKLIKDFHYVIDSDLNTWFKRTFLWAFIDNWTNKVNNSYELNTVWSRAAIEKKIANMQAEVKPLYTKKCQELNHEHTVPKVFFEDIFIDGPTIKDNPDKKIAHKERIIQSYSFYQTLREQSEAIDYNIFLTDFFDKFIQIVTLTKGEHSALTSQSSMPELFFTTQNIWDRYDWGRESKKCRVCKNCMIKPIELYKVDYSMNTLSSIDWREMNFSGLINYGIVKSPLNKQCKKNNIPSLPSRF